MTTNVWVTGWNKGFNKVEFSRLLRSQAGRPVGEAKQAVDRLLAEQRLSFAFADEESAGNFCQSARLIGAVCDTV